MNPIAQDCKENTFKQVYLIYGEEEYLCRLYKEMLLKALGTAEDSMNFTRFEGKQTPEEKVIGICETMPFFAERRVVLLEDTGFFKDKKERLPDYLKELPDYLVLIFAEREADKRGRMYKAAAAYERIIECKAPEEQELNSWILSRLKKAGKVIRKSTLEKFRSGSGNDMNFIACELEKLISYTGERQEITAADIDAVCSLQVENKIFDMITDAAAGRREKALREYQDLLLLKEPPMRILALMERQFDQLLRIRELSAKGMGQKLIADALKLHPYAVKKNQPLAAKYSVQELRAAVEDYVAAEEDVKTGRLSDRMSVELMLMKYSKA